MSGTRTGGGAKILALVVAFAGLLGFAAWFSGQEGDPAEPGGEDRGSARLVILTVVWGHFETVEGGEVHFGTDDRDLSITYYIDDVPHVAERDERAGEPWSEYLALQPGTHIRLLVEQHGLGGFLLCQIVQDDRVIDSMTRNDAGDCDVSGVVE